MASFHLIKSKSQSLRRTDTALTWYSATLSLYPLFSHLQTCGPLPFFEHNIQAPVSRFLAPSFPWKALPEILLTQISLLPLLKCHHITGSCPTTLRTIPLPSSLASLFSVSLTCFCLFIVYYLLPPQEQRLCLLCSLPYPWSLNVDCNILRSQKYLNN